MTRKRVHAGTGSWRRLASRLVFALAVIAGCSPDAPIGILPTGEGSLAKGSSGGSDPTVTAANPSAAATDTTIDVTIFGSGFTTGARATWSLAGDTGLVHVQSTNVIASDRIIARINVPASAPLALYDIEVMLSNGKKGVGAELFEVQSRIPGEKDPNTTWKIPLADAGLALRSDHQFSDGSNSLYSNTVCSVTGKIFATMETTPTPSGDAVTMMSYAKGKSCGRTVTVVYPDGGQDRLSAFFNLNKLHNNTDASTVIPVGQTSQRRLIIGFEATLLHNPNSGRCGRVIFGDNGIVGAGTDMLLVTRLGPTTWHVRSQPAPNNRAFCETLNVMYGNMNVDFVIESRYALPG